MKNLKEISANMAEFEGLKAQRELTELETKQYSQLCREFETAKRENDIELQERQAASIKAPVAHKSLQSMIREAAQKNEKLNLNLAQREFTTTDGAAVIDNNIQNILDPKYAASALAAAGAKYYTGLPMGNVSVPVLGKGTVGWKGEIAAAVAAGQTITSVELQPKRLTAYVDISNMMIAEDTHEAEQAIMRDLVAGVYEKLEATILGAEAGGTTKPAGIFYGKTISDGTTFANVCDIEATIESNNYGNLKYIVSPASKADFRTMSYGGKSTSNVWSNNEVDGTPAIVTSNVAKGTYVVGDFSNLAVGLWGNVEITVDEKSQAINGCTRLVVNCFADAKVLREAAFAYGKTRTA